METNNHPFNVNTTQTEEQVRQVYAFAVSVLENLSGIVHTLDFYLDHFHKTPSLLVYAEKEGQVVGSILGSIDEDHVLVGMVAVASHARRMGVGQAMMNRLEHESKKLDQTTLILGSLQEAEEFYLSCGFKPNLFIQMPEPGQLDELKRLNQHYPVVWEADDDGWTRLMLSTPKIDRLLQDEYDLQFQPCFTQYVFIKELEY